MKKESKLCFIISGNGRGFQFVQNAIEKELLPNAVIAYVISNRIEAKGLRFAEEHSIPVKIFAGISKERFESNVLECLEQEPVNLICLSSYRWLLSPDFISKNRWKIINSHPSLLPDYPGFKAIDRVLDDQVPYTGTTIHYVDEGIDTGKIIKQGKVKVAQDDTVTSLFDKIMEVEKILYVEAIKEVLKIH